MRAVRMIKQTISILLAAQLLFSFGLCGGICCVKSAELSAPQIAIQAVEPEENMPPCHRKKAAEKTAAKQDQTLPAHSDHRTLSINQNPVGKIAASVLNRNCCLMKRETPEGESLLTIFAPQSSKQVGVLGTSPWRDDEIAIGLPQIPTQVSSTHSPPHTGFQLSLRI